MTSPFRQDGRKHDELRSIQFQLSTSNHDGSCIAQQGNTRVDCHVEGPCEPTRNSNSLLSITLEICPFSGTERRRRVRVAELEALIKDALMPVIISTTYPNSEIRINLKVIQNDGGLLITCIHAAVLALMDAGIAMTDYVCGCTIGNNLLDLNWLEECDTPYIAMATVGASDELALAVTDSRIHKNQLAELMLLGAEGCHVVRQAMEDAARKSSYTLQAKSSFK